MKIMRTKGQGAEQLRMLLGGISNKVGKVGFFPSSVYEDGTPVAYVATIQEYGVAQKGIPPRPFMRPTIEKQRMTWRAIADQGARSMLAGKATGDQVLEAIGLKASGDIRRTISQIQSPPLSQVTIELRKQRREGRTITGKTVGEAYKATQSAFYKNVSSSSPIAKPLVDSALMKESVSYEVSEK